MSVKPQIIKLKSLNSLAFRPFMPYTIDECKRDAF